MDQYINRFYSLIKKGKVTMKELQEIIFSPIVTWYSIDHNKCLIETNCDDQYTLYIIDNEMAI